MKATTLVVAALLTSLAQGVAAAPPVRDRHEAKDSKEKRSDAGQGFRQFVEDDFAQPSRHAVETRRNRRGYR